MFRLNIPALPRIGSFVGMIARPYVLLSSATAASVATIQTAIYAPNLEGAAFIAAVWTGVAALYTAKAWEEQKKTGQSADVKIAQAKGASE
jgi:hypothetical protein